MTKNSIYFQIVPPHNRRANSRAIQTLKTHFKSGIRTVYSDFPIAEWDRLLPQAFVTLNLLHPANANNKQSANFYLFGNYDFNKTPMAPPGSKVAHKYIKHLLNIHPGTSMVNYTFMLEQY